jgi:hypothetical protein
MKTPNLSFVIAVVCCLGIANLYGQARVNFAPTSATPLRITDGTITPLGFTTPGTITQVLGTASTAAFGIGPASVRVELLAGTSSGSLASVLVGIDHNVAYVTNYSGTVASFQGLFSGGAPLPLPGFDGSAPVFFQFRAWSIGGDNPLSFDDRLLSGTGFAGSSETISVTPTVGVELPATLFGVGPNLWQGLTLYTVVPEPAAFALLSLALVVCVATRGRGRKP